MRKITGNNGGLFSRSTTGALVLLLVVAGQPGWQTSWPPAAAARKITIDLSQLQAIKPGTPITVVLHQDRGPRGDRKLRGRFQSVTDDSITLKMEYGSTRTLPRSAVRKVVVHHRPPKSKRDWSRVQAVAPGTPTAVVLYQDQAPPENRKSEGRFHSATDDSLTLERKDGQRHTFPKWAVRKVLVPRPVLNRYQAWITTGIGIAFSIPFASTDFSAAVAPFLIGIFAAFGFLLAPRKGGIYHVPPKHRIKLQKDQPSGAEGKASGNFSH